MSTTLVSRGRARGLLAIALRASTAAAALALTSLAWAATAPSDTLTLASESKVWVEGGSTVRSWKCEAVDMQGNIETQSDAALGSLSELNALVKGVLITIGVEKMECGNKTMNEHMRKALKSKDSPNITFQVTSYEVTGRSDTTAGLIMKGKLGIAGAENEVTVVAEATRGANGAVHVRGKHEFPMTQFGVKPPSLMLGTMKVKDKVAVNFDVTLK